MGQAATSRFDLRHIWQVSSLSTKKKLKWIIYNMVGVKLPILVHVLYSKTMGAHTCSLQEKKITLDK
jgi:hypothetical protein